MKIFYLTELLSPYRVEWMNMLCDGNEVLACYMTAGEKTRDDRWLADKKPRFKTKQVKMSSALRGMPSREFLSEVRSSDFDIYLIDGYSSPTKLKVIRALLRRNKRVFINIDGIDVWRQKSRSDVIKDHIKKRVYRSGACFLCGSRIAADSVKKGGADEKRVFVHPFTSMHTEDIISYEQKAELQRACKHKLGRENQKLALAVGRFIPLKRYDCLIRAWKDMPADRFLYIIGGGTERKNYEALIKELGVKNIELIDFMLPKQLEDYFRAADLFVHTSETETWGLVFNEAMASACPVIATNRCVGAVELVTDGEEGYLVDVGDEKALREAMEKILGDDELRQKMMKNAAERIQGYTYENLAAQHLKIFRDAIAETTQH